MIKKLKNIKISKEFKMSYPNTLKLISKTKYYLRNKKFEQTIIIDKNNVLVDGYTSYIIAQMLNKKICESEKSMKQIDKNTKCYNCLGCNRLEDENFKGIYRCEYAVLEQTRINEEEQKKRC